MQASRHTWDTLADCWHLCEAGGMQPVHIESFRSRLAAPVLVVGSGQGLLSAALRDWYPHGVYGVDWSRRMLVSVRTINAAAGVAQMLPFRDGSFRSIVCASGVIDPCSPVETEGLFNEFRRVTQPGGVVAGALFRPSPQLMHVASSLGIVDGACQHMQRIIALWRCRNAPRTAVRLVSEWTGLSLRGARDAIARGQDFLESWFGLFDRTRDGASRSGTSVLTRAFGWTLHGVPDEAAALSIFRSMRPVTTFYDEARSTQLVLAEN